MNASAVDNVNFNIQHSYFWSHKNKYKEDIFQINTHFLLLVWY